MIVEFRDRNDHKLCFDSSLISIVQEVDLGVEGFICTLFFKEETSFYGRCFSTNESYRSVISKIWPAPKDDKKK